MELFYLNPLFSFSVVIGFLFTAESYSKRIRNVFLRGEQEYILERIKEIKGDLAGYEATTESMKINNSVANNEFKVKEVLEQIEKCTESEIDTTASFIANEKIKHRTHNFSVLSMFAALFSIEIIFLGAFLRDACDCTFEMFYSVLFGCEVFYIFFIFLLFVRDFRVKYLQKKVGFKWISIVAILFHIFAFIQYKNPENIFFDGTSISLISLLLAVILPLSHYALYFLRTFYVDKIISYELKAGLRSIEKEVFELRIKFNELSELYKSISQAGGGDIYQIIPFPESPKKT
jgi:hypothetical protein